MMVLYVVVDAVEAAARIYLRFKWVDMHTRIGITRRTKYKKNVLHCLKKIKCQMAATRCRPVTSHNKTALEAAKPKLTVHSN